MFFDDPLLWELHLLPSHEFDYLHLINLLLQNKYYIFPIIQKSFLNSGSFQSLYSLMITPFTTWRIFIFHSIASFVLFSFFPFLFSFLPSFLPSFFFLSFLLFLFCRGGQNQRKIQEWIAVIFGSLKNATLAPAQVMNSSV